MKLGCQFSNNANRSLLKCISAQAGYFYNPQAGLGGGQQGWVGAPQSHPSNVQSQLQINTQVPTPGNVANTQRAQNEHTHPQVQSIFNSVKITHSFYSDSIIITKLNPFKKNIYKISICILSPYIIRLLYNYITRNNQNNKEKS